MLEWTIRNMLETNEKIENLRKETESVNQEIEDMKRKF